MSHSLNYHMPAKIYKDIASAEGEAEALWQAFNWWLDLYRLNNPLDAQTSYQLIDEFEKGHGQ